MKFSALATHCANVRPTRTYVVFPLLIMAMLYWLSSLPGAPLPEDPAAYAVFHWIPPSVQNILHVPSYAVLAWAWRWALAAWLRHNVAIAVSAFAVAALYGLIDEWHQSFVPGRYASLTDVALDTVGAALGIWAFHWALRRGRGVVA